MRRNKSKQMIRIFATVMAIVLLATCVPMSVFGASEDFPLSDVTDVTESTAGDAGGVSVIDGDTIVTGDVIGEYVEVLSRREENVKHFALPDGTYTAIVYPNAVHRKDADGVWQDIDNDLALLSVKGTQKYATADSRVSFSKSFSQSAELMTLSENGYAISMSLLQDNNAIISTETMSLAAPVITNSVKRELPKTDVKIEDVAKVDNKSSILYNNVRANTDIEYILDGNAVKENIIVRATSNNYEYSFDLRLDGLVALLNANGSISINDAETSDEKYIIPAPYMFDADGNTSTAVEYTLIEISSERYLLSVTADKTWINTPGRAFPVTIDPTITYSANIVDTFISFTSEGTSFGDYPELWVSYDNDTYIKMDMPGLPDGATLIDATLFVYYYYHISTGSMLVGAFEPLDDWSESVSLNTAPGYDTPAISTYVLSASASISQSNPGLAGFDVTALAQTWYSDPSSNNGVVLAKINDSSHTNQSVILRAFESGEDCSFIAVDYAYDFPEGVYAIENDVFPDYWITVENDETLLGNYIQYEPLSYSPTTTFDRSGLFKISQKGTTSRYIIRSMLNNRLGVGIVNGEIVTKRLPASDDDVANEDTFYIEWIDNGFYFKPYSTNMYISGSDTGMAENLSLVQADNASSNAKWHLTKYTGNGQSGVELNLPDNLVAGQRFVAPAYSWSTSIEYNTFGVTVDDASSNVATIEWNDEENIEYSIHDNGTLKFVIPILGCTNNDILRYCNQFYQVSLPFEEGAYYISSKKNGMYIQYNDNPIFPTNHTNLELTPLNNDRNQKWLFVHVVDGYYKIRSIESGDVISVQTEHENESNEPLVQSPYSGEYTQQWKLTYDGIDSYVIRPRSGEQYSDDLCISIENSVLDTPGMEIKQNKYRGRNSEKWVLDRIYFSLTVNNRYDLGYSVYYGETSADTVAKIRSYNSSVASRYMQIFGLTLIYNDAQYYESPIDLCKGVVTSANIVALCNHSGLLHTDRDSVILDYITNFPGSNIVTNALWSCHRIKSLNASGETEYNRSCSLDNCIFMFEAENTRNRDLNSIGILLHELNHQIGAFDHYHEEDENEICKNEDICSDCNEELRPKTCIMYNSRVDITTEDIICEDCQFDIYQHLSLHHETQ